MFKIVTKTKQMRDIVERNLEEVNLMIEFSRRQNLSISESDYLQQRIALENILNEFDKLDGKTE